MALLSFRKNPKLQNLLFDEYFSEYSAIDILAFNYDGNGAALCSCDGALTPIDLLSIRKIVFGAPREAVKNYLHGIFDPASPSEHSNRKNGDLVFRLQVLNKLKKYDILNLAKRTLKDFQEREEECFYYFSQSAAPALSTKSELCSTAFYGNTNSKVVHRAECKSFNAISCTSLFDSLAAAKSAGFTPCRMCKP